MAQSAKPSAPLPRVGRRGEQLPAEMKQFLSKIEAWHPDELMKGVGDSGLGSGITLATVITVVLMAALTVGPYYLIQNSKPGAEAKPAATAAASAAATPAAQPAENASAAAEPAAATTASAGNATAASGPSAKPVLSEKARKKLDVDEVKSSDPAVNPLDSKLDDLMDNLK